MRFALLGPLTVDSEDGPVVVKGLLPRGALAMLLAHANQVVSLESLAHTLWGEQLPATASSALRNHMLRLRQFLGDADAELIRTNPRGYSIRIEPGDLDIEDFEALCARGTRAAQEQQWSSAADDLAEALALWRGEPFADVPPPAGSEVLVNRLHEIRLLAYEARIEADLRLGRHAEVVGELVELTTEHPLREVLQGQLMLALYRCGRQAEALGVYRRLRQVMVEELGLEPGEAIRQLQADIIRGAGRLKAPVAGTQSGAGTGAAPASSSSSSNPARVTAAAAAAPAAAGLGMRWQLPADSAAFTGRTAEISILTATLGPGADADGDAGPGPDDDSGDRGDDSGPNTPTVCVIDGMGGVGKTALAVHAAHRVKHRYPDGQLFFDLRGHTPGREPASPEEALDYLLRCVDVPAGQIPPDLAARGALWRSRLSGTRTLIVLDNAVDAAQVGPLLPADPGCTTLITSRRSLSGLDDARVLSLDVLGDEEARTLLCRAAGAGRVSAQHPALPELVRLCGYVPLAIRIVASQLRHRRALDVADVVAGLRGGRDGDRLERLRDDDRELAAVFASSFERLPEAERRVFCFLGLVPGPDFGAEAVACLADVPVRAAERLLGSLLGHSLLLQFDARRFRLHDLLRAYARTVGARIGAEEAERGVDRLVAFYVRAAEAADGMLPTSSIRERRQEYGQPVDQRTNDQDSNPGPSAAGIGFPDADAAMAWLRAERENLLAVAAYAAATGRRRQQIALASALTTLLSFDGPMTTAAQLHVAAAEAARALGDPAAEAYALVDASFPIRNVSGVEAARAALERAAGLFEDLGLSGDEAECHLRLAHQAHMTGEHRAAVRYLDQALPLLRAAGRRRGEGSALRTLGRIAVTDGDIEAAERWHQEALGAFRDAGHRMGEAATLADLGWVREHVADYPAAEAYFRASLEVNREIGHLANQGHALYSLALVRTRTGEFAGAAEYFARSRQTFEGMGSVLNTAMVVGGEAELLLATGDLDGAAAQLAAALAVFTEQRQAEAVADTRQMLARVRLAQGDVAEAGRLAEAAVAGFRQTRDLRDLAEALITCGEVAIAEGDAGRGTELCAEAVATAREARSPASEARGLMVLGRCRESSGDVIGALTEVGAAAEIYRRTGSWEAGGATEQEKRLAEAVGAAAG